MRAHTGAVLDDQPDIIRALSQRLSKGRRGLIEHSVESHAPMAAAVEDHPGRPDAARRVHVRGKRADRLDHEVRFAAHVDQVAGVDEHGRYAGLVLPRPEGRHLGIGSIPEPPGPRRRGENLDRLRPDLQGPVERLVYPPRCRYVCSQLHLPLLSSILTSTLPIFPPGL